MSQPQPSAIYVWLVPSEHVLEQPGSWRIRKWDTEPFPEANFVACSESARSDEAGVLDALAVNSGYQRWWIHAGRLHFERDGQPGRIEVMLPHSCTVQSAIGRTCPENNLPCERACLGGWCQTMFGFPPEDELVPADRHLDKNVPSTKATVK